MKTYTLDDVAVLIDKVNKYNDDIINFRTEENAADNLQIEKAEKALGLKFNSSYKIFLKKTMEEGKNEKNLKTIELHGSLKYSWMSVRQSSPIDFGFMGKA